MIKSTSRFAPLVTLFRGNDKSEREMMTQLARVCVLYEDIQIEFVAATANAMPELDRIGAHARKLYFIRRSLATLMELDGAFHQLNKNDDFKVVRAWMKHWHQQLWDDGIKFFAANKQFLKDWRNDVGGHFHQSAATFALADLHPQAVGLVEIFLRGSGADARLPFAADLVGSAMAKLKPKGQSDEEFFKEAFSLTVTATKHVVEMVGVLTLECLLPRCK